MPEAEVATLSENYASRLVDLSPASMRHLRLRVPNAYDLVLSQLEPNIGRDRDDVLFIAKAERLKPATLRERYMSELLTRVLRPGDIYAHMYSGLRGEQDPATKGPSQAMLDGRKRGILFDVSHGSGSFRWRVAVPLVRAGFTPDTIGTDLHVRSMNTGLKDILDLMSKFLAMGLSLEQVVTANTWNAARAIKQEQLGHLAPGAVADVAVLRLETGDFGFADHHGARLKGRQRLRCEMTILDGKVVYDLNNLTGPDWETLPADYGDQGDARWHGYRRPRASTR